MDTAWLQVAQIVPCTEAEGPGKRFALWFQGCPLRCPGCCNPEFLSFKGGQQMPLQDVIDLMLAAKMESQIEGISLLGGEPLAHAAGASALATVAWEQGLSVMVYSGFVLEEAQKSADPDVANLLNHTDVLVDGPYIREQPDTVRRWIGSTNQRVHLLTNRYQASDPCWTMKNTLEIRVRGSEISVNGFPAPNAVGLWKKPRRVEG